MLYKVRSMTPLGEAELLASDTALVAAYCTEGSDIKPNIAALRDTAVEVEQPNAVLRQTCQELNEYFAGTRHEFSVPLLPEGTPFERRVWKALQDIPFGETQSYSVLTERLGDIKALRAVAAANGRNPLWILIPCHRVIGKHGELTGYAGGLWRKEWLLKHEGALPQGTLF